MVAGRPDPSSADASVRIEDSQGFTTIRPQSTGWEGRFPSPSPHHRADATVHGGSSGPLQGPEHREESQESPLCESIIRDSGVHV